MQKPSESKGMTAQSTINNGNPNRIFSSERRQRKGRTQTPNLVPTISEKIAHVNSRNIRDMDADNGFSETRIQTRSVDVTVKDVILLRYEEIAQVSQHTLHDEVQKATILFQIFLNFILENNWDYFEPGHKLIGRMILKKPSDQTLQVNCFELSKAFISLCSAIRITADMVVYKHRTCKRLGEELSGTTNSMNCFDKKIIFIDNQAIFDLHCVAKVKGRFFDLVFSCFYDNKDDPFDDTPYGELISYLDSKNEKSAIKLLKEINLENLEQTFEGWTLLHRAANYGLCDVAALLLEMDIDANFHTTTDPAVALDYVKDIDSDLFDIIASKTKRSTVLEITSPKLIDGALEMIRKNQILALRKTIQKGLKIDQQNINGWTMLHQAVCFQKKEIVIWLLQNHANANIKNTEGNKALDLCFILSSKIFKMVSAHTNTTTTFTKDLHKKAFPNNQRNHLKQKKFFTQELSPDTVKPHLPESVRKAKDPPIYKLL
jgi:ankyrin repeat protein